MIIKFILCLGDAAHISSFKAFTRQVEITKPTPRGDLLLCPITPELIVLTSVIEIRVGDTHPILIAQAHDDCEDDDLEHALELSSEWVRTHPVCDMRGQAIGVFVDDDLTDPMLVEDWNYINESEISLLVSLGLIGDVKMIKVPGINFQQKSSSEDPEKSPKNQDLYETMLENGIQNNVPVVDLGEWKANNKEN